MKGKATPYDGGTSQGSRFAHTLQEGKCDISVVYQPHLITRAYSRIIALSSEKCKKRTKGEQKVNVSLGAQAGCSTLENRQMHRWTHARLYERENVVKRNFHRVRKDPFSIIIEYPHCLIFARRRVSFSTYATDRKKVLALYGGSMAQQIALQIGNRWTNPERCSWCVHGQIISLNEV